MRQERRDHSVNMSRKQNFRNERLVKRVQWCREDEIIKAQKHLLDIVTEKSQEGFQGHSSVESQASSRIWLMKVEGIRDRESILFNGGSSPKSHSVLSVTVFSILPRMVPNWYLSKCTEVAIRALAQRSASFAYEEPHTVPCNHSALLLWHQSSHQQYTKMNGIALCQGNFIYGH